MALPWATSLSVAYVGQHSFNTFQGTNINTVDLGATFLPENQDTTLAASTTPGATRALGRPAARRSAATAAINLQWQRGWRTYHSIQLSFQRRFQNGVSFGFNDTIGLSDRQQAGARLAARRGRHLPASAPIRRRRMSCSATTTRRRTSCARTSCGICRTCERDSGVLKAIGLRDQRLAALGHLVGRTGTAYTVGFSYQSGGGNREPDRLARLRRAHSRRGRSGRGLQQQRHVPAVQPGGVPGTAGRTASASSRATATCAAASRACSTWRSRGTSGWPAAGASSCASTCSTRRIRPTSPAAARR